MSDISDQVVGMETAPAAAPKLEWPRIALVTPVYNSVHYIEQTIRSVLEQNYPNLDYFIVDGGSTDGTINVIRKYDNQISGWLSEPDKGMYDALNKGFSRTSGEIMGWISATDLLQPGGLLALGAIFRDLPEVEWVTGRPSWFNEEGAQIAIGAPPRWSRIRYLAGANRYIQQESTFWRRNLWDRTGACVDSSRRGAADFELWVRFFRHTRLYPADTLIGGFRQHGDSLGLQDLEAWHRVHDEFINAELRQMWYGRLLGLFRSVSRLAEATPILRRVWSKFVIHPLYECPGRDWAPVIRYDVAKGWHLET